MSKLILISGSPGSGKTTLAKILSERLHFEFLDSDEYLEDVWRKHKNEPDYDRESKGMRILFEHIRNELKQDGRRIITDVVLVDGKNEKMLEDLLGNTASVWFHCVSNHSLDRYQKREQLADGSMPDWFASHFKYLQENNYKMSSPLKINRKPIVIRTDGNYLPSFDKITELIDK